MDLHKSDTFETAAEGIFKWFEATLEPEGYYPFPMVVFKDGGLMDLHALDLTVEQCLMHFCTATLEKNVRFAFMGIDRTTMPGQGTTLGDVLTVFTYERAPEHLAELRVRDQYRKFAIMEYQVEPKIVQPFNYENAFWKRQMAGELFQFLPALVITRNVTVH